MATRGIALPVWPSLPRGFVVARKYRVETEVGRGGMASVYKAVPLAKFETTAEVAIKVPAPDLMTDAGTPPLRAGNQRLAATQRDRQGGIALRGRPPQIVATLGYELFDDPHSGRETYGLVLEYVNGMTLAKIPRERAEAKRG